jgi:hypothetical protein
VLNSQYPCIFGRNSTVPKVVWFYIDLSPVAYPGILFGGWGWGGSTNSVEDRGQSGDLGGGSPIVGDSGGSCNLVQEISFHIVKFS